MGGGWGGGLSEAWAETGPEIQRFFSCGSRGALRHISWRVGCGFISPSIWFVSKSWSLVTVGAIWPQLYEDLLL